jgi:hypothetical protein
VLLNLLIALMSSTYEKAQESSALTRLLDTYHLVQDASYISNSGAIKGEGRKLSS